MNRQPKIILLVDDDNNFCFLLQMMFKKSTYTLVIKNSGDEAWEYIQQSGKENQPDLILLDLQMPKMSGYSFIEQYRQNKGDAPVIAVTALVTTNDRLKAATSGFDDFLAKPFSEKELFSAINTLIQ